MYISLPLRVVLQKMGENKCDGPVMIMTSRYYSCAFDIFKWAARLQVLSSTYLPMHSSPWLAVFIIIIINRDGRCKTRDRK